MPVACKHLNLVKAVISAMLFVHLAVLVSAASFSILHGTGVVCPSDAFTLVLVFSPRLDCVACR